jgi:hypothetical protein
VKLAFTSTLAPAIATWLSLTVFSQIPKYRSSSRSVVLAFMFEQFRECWNGEAQNFMKFVFAFTLETSIMAWLLPLTMFSQLFKQRNCGRSGFVSKQFNECRNYEPECLMKLAFHVHISGVYMARGYQSPYFAKFSSRDRALR